MKSSHYTQAVRLRKKGWSYNFIAKKLQVSKSTLSNWLRNIPYTPNKATIKRIKAGPAKSAMKRKQQKIERIKIAHQLAHRELGILNKRDLWMLGIGLYLGEGSKKFEEARVANADPKIIRLLIAWFVTVCKVPKENIQLRLYAYPDTNVKKVLKYWSGITKLSLQAFTKVIIDKRTDKKAKKWSALPNGTIHIIVRERGRKELGVALHRKIMGWIEAVYTNAGIV